MKKNILFLLISILCFILGGTFVYFFVHTENDTFNEQTTNDYSNIKFQTGKYRNKIWNEDTYQNSLESECVPDMESAIQIASIIFNNKQKQGLFKEYELQSVFYDEYESIWIISFWTNHNEKNGEIVISADYNIAISKKTGEILKEWVGE